MVIVLVSLGILVFGIVANKIYDMKYNASDFLASVATVCTIIGIVSTFFCVFFFIVTHCNIDGTIREHQAKRESLVYQLENKTYLNDNNVGTNELFTQIGEFNGEIEWERTADNGYIINWLTSPWSNYVEPIDINNY